MSDSTTVDGMSIPFDVQTLQDIGLSYAFGYQKVFGKFQMAKTIGSVDAIEGDQIKSLFQIGTAW